MEEYKDSTVLNRINDFMTEYAHLSGEEIYRRLWEIYDTGYLNGERDAKLESNGR